MKKLYHSILIIGTSLFFSSCLVHYVAPPINNPLLSQEAEVMVNAGFCGGEYVATSNVNIAYSPIQNIGIGYSYSSYSANAETITNGVSSTYKLYDGMYNELMIGYYKQFSKHGILECYGGFGLGSSNNFYNEYSNNNNNNGGSSKLGYTRAFIMPSVGTKYKNFQASFGIKLYQLNFHRNDMFNVTEPYINDLVTRLSNKPYYFADPGATIRFGHKNFMFYSQLGFSQKLSSELLDYEQLKFSVGLQFQFVARGPKLRN
jgi:hypothetical protein